jgi:LPPG:FO 2-phospho-L-lactate transferase
VGGTLIVVLAGGVGAARFLEGLVRVVSQEQITIIGNVGDDIEIHGLHISPDLDIVTYTLAGLVDPIKGWGFRDDTFHCQTLLHRYGYQTWFNLGDRDIATHLYRTQELHNGNPLSEVTLNLTKRFGLRAKLIPATDDSLRTHVLASNRWMHFQEYMVKLKTNPHVRSVRFTGAKSSRPGKHVIESIRKASGIIIAPSNPIVSIGAVLAVPGIRSALRKTKSSIVGISPIIGGKPVKGPADKLMKACGIAPSAVGVAKCYSDFLDTLILDQVDRSLARDIEELGIKPVVTNTLMKTLNDKTRLARLAVSELKN